MVIFHSYVSLPEGIVLSVARDQVSNSYDTSNIIPTRLKFTKAASCTRDQLFVSTEPKRSYRLHVGLSILSPSPCVTRIFF